MDKLQEKNKNKIRRHSRVRAKVRGTAKCPRFSVFRSNRHIFLQLIDDSNGKTIVSSSDLKIKEKVNKTEASREAGKGLAKLAIEKKIKKVVFDRGGCKYHGRVKAVADGAREAGLTF